MKQPRVVRGKRNAIISINKHLSGPVVYWPHVNDIPARVAFPFTEPRSWNNSQAFTEIIERFRIACAIRRDETRLNTRPI